MDSVDKSAESVSQNSSFKYIDQKMLDSAEQINLETYMSETENSENKIGVYVKLDSNGYVIDVCSDIFLEDTSGWVKIDEGFGDRFAHARSQYFPNGIIDNNANFTQKIK